MAKKKSKKRKKKSGNPAKNASATLRSSTGKAQTISAATQERNRWIAIFAVSAVLLLLVVVYLMTRNAQQTRLTSTDDTESNNVAEETVTPDEIADDETPVPETAYAQIDVQDYGTITLELDGTAAPQTVRNFINLANSGFYDGLTFHRIMSGFMIQGGDPLGNGTGGSDTNVYGEFSANGVDNPISHLRGTVSMARSNDPNSASSQFFIVHEDSTFLDGNYAAFGHVIDGMDVVDQIAADAHPIDDNGTIPAEEQPIINSITILEEPSAMSPDETADDVTQAADTPDETDETTPDEATDTPDESAEPIDETNESTPDESAEPIDETDETTPDESTDTPDETTDTPDETDESTPDETTPVIEPGDIIEPEDEAVLNAQN